MPRDFTTRKRIILGGVICLVAADFALAAYSFQLASEPLTTDQSSWLEVPEYSMLTAELTPAGIEFETRDLDV